MYVCVCVYVCVRVLGAATQTQSLLATRISLKKCQPPDLKTVYVYVQVDTR